MKLDVALLLLRVNAVSFSEIIPVFLRFGNGSIPHIAPAAIRAAFRIRRPLKTESALAYVDSQSISTPDNLILLYSRKHEAASVAASFQYKARTT